MITACPIFVYGGPEWPNGLQLKKNPANGKMLQKHTKETEKRTQNRKKENAYVEKLQKLKEKKMELFLGTQEIDRPYPDITS